MKEHVHNHNHEHSGCSCCAGKMEEKMTAQHHEESHTKDLVQIILGLVLIMAAVVCEKVFQVPEVVALIIYVIAYLILGGEIVLSAVRNIGKGQVFDENFLMSIATIGAFCIREYPEAVGVMLFFRIGEFFEEVAVERSRKQIMEAVDMRPDVVCVEMHGHTHEIPAEEVAVGSIVVVRPGDLIPLDGIVVEGDSRVDTAAITGESVPVHVKEYDEVMSGCVNQSGLLRIQVTKPLEESMVSRILHSVEHAAASKPKVDHFISRFAKVYTPIVVAVALFTAIAMPLIRGEEFYPWVYTALSFLVMSCPCAVVLSVPLAFFCGIGCGSKQGILFKGGVAIEALRDVKNVIMDKTGTITKGNFVLQSVQSTGAMSEADLIQLAASCEQNSSHPIANGILSAAHERELILKKPECVEEISGYGLRVQIDGKEVLCGNAELLTENGVDITEYQPDMYATEVLLAVDGIYVGSLAIADTIKEEAKEAISQIKKRGIHTVMLTGDNEKTARAIADKLGIEEVHAKLLPEDKLAILTDIRRKKGSVMFVGDGMNDAPVLAGADVGAAMGSGADAAIEAADVVFMNSDVKSVDKAIALAKHTTRIAMQNVVFAIGVKAIVMILGLSGIYSNMWLAVFADTGVAFLCILNSIRILRKK